MTPSPYSREATLSEDQRRIEAQRARPPRAKQDDEPLAQYRIHPSARHIFRRGPWELLATIIIGLGVLMLMQPFMMTLFTYSFITILIGTVMFIIVSHFPD